MIELFADRPNRITLAADKGYDTQDFVNEARSMNVTPHVTQNMSGRRSAIDGRVTRHVGYAASQRIRKRIEEVFGWGKEIGAMRRTRFRGLERVGLSFGYSRGLQPHPPAEAADGMTKKKTIAGKWRMTGMSTWDRAYIDLVEPGFVTFAIREMGEMAFGVVNATLDCAFDASKSNVSFEFTGYDEGDEISGEGWAELIEPDKIKGEIEFHNGDETIFNASRW